MEKKDVSTINNCLYHDSDKQVDLISDSNKQFDPRSDPKSETHIFDRVRRLSARVGLFEQTVIIGRIVPVTNVVENSRVELSLNSLSPLNTNMSKAFVIGSACKSVGVNRNIINCTSHNKKIRNHSRIGTPGVNEGVFSPSSNTTSSFAKWTGNIKPLDTSVHVSATQERNSDFSCIEKVA